MSEAEFQSRVIETLSGQGLLVQKFNDLFTEGIPDFTAELPAPADRAPSGMPHGLWLEAKFCSAAPKRKNSAWPKKVWPSAAQMGWMRRWDQGSKPCAMLLSTPYGWTCVPFALIDTFFARPHGDTRHLFTEERPTYGAICRSLALCKSKLN